MRSVLGSVRAQAALGATLVVAVALLVTGIAVLSVLRANLLAQAGLQAELSAREIAAQFATGNDPRKLARDAEAPVQVLGQGGRVLAVSDGLEAISGTASARVTVTAGAWVVPPGADHRPLGDGDEPARDDDETDDAGESDRLRGDDDDADNADADADADADDADADNSDNDGDDDADDDGEVGDDRGGEDRDQRERDRDDDRDDPVPSAGEVAQDVTTTDGTAVVDGAIGSYRFVSLQATSPQGQTVTVYAGAPLAAEREAVGTVRDAMLVGLPVLSLVVAGVTWMTTHRALRPVEGVRGEMAAITRSEDLSRRVPEPRSRDEIGRLARTTNETLAALEASVARQRRFVADASHELRSPLASLRTQLEVGAAHPELLDVEGAVEDTVRLQTLAADLLLLARLDAGEKPGTARVALPALVREELARRVGHPVMVRAHELAPSEVTGSSGQLARLLANLLDNAQRHAATTVGVTVRAACGWAVLEVSDDGAGVPEADRERIFERFVRLDEARSRDDGGAGLGLAIARDIAVRHGGTLGVEMASTGGARFVLRLPAAVDSGRRSPSDR